MGNILEIFCACEAMISAQLINIGTSQLIQHCFGKEIKRYIDPNVFKLSLL
jgi:hypothetical protein